MNFGNILIILFLVYYTIYLFSLLNKSIRNSIQIKNKELESYRKIKIKTIEEQKEFINLKFPKKVKKNKFSWKSMLNVIVYILIFVILFQIYNYLFDYFSVIIKLWIAVLVIIIMPILINYILKKFSLEKDDLLVYLR